MLQTGHLERALTRAPSEHQEYEHSENQTSEASDKSKRPIEATPLIDRYPRTVTFSRTTTFQQFRSDSYDEIRIPSRILNFNLDPLAAPQQNLYDETRLAAVSIDTNNIKNALTVQSQFLRRRDYSKLLIISNPKVAVEPIRLEVVREIRLDKAGAAVHRTMLDQ
jgi:hypothetical protein